MVPTLILRRCGRFAGRLTSLFGAVVEIVGCTEFQLGRSLGIHGAGSVE